MSFSPANSIASFVPTSIYFPDNSEEFRVKLIEILQTNANAVNNREISTYISEEILTGQSWFDPANSQNVRNTFRKVFSFSDASLTFNHNITGAVLFTHIYGGGTDGAGNFFPIPYVSATAANNQIQVDVTATQVIITKGAGTPPTISNAVLVLEYLKN